MLVRIYLQGVRSRPLVTSPREVLLVHLTVGVTFAAGSMVLYAVGSRGLAWWGG